ncbi:MAG: hypothetical protein A2X05_04880 [Bacteroidetes bacterium GWE2_41_25]|nr:MAG: hypothetical protein A2X03_09840 [Bacteroidetes bacterium GWA2_40_15]OFX93464.1 MAG: hypothetical protein A2X05_04880 [Bacteroidetes bacterium GWE2_41_25]OFX95053.1 MAG: hypothetical protein A2X06_09270 [Bacteroidetes bacterium GWC2_40_22]OFY59949.1 MAG: hypothetical protein A2X04_05920 [Bacteroidetes bacterium GWF2_41_9]HAM10098.1 hypothetical protein [Bacteroidales bacterium]
MSLSCETRKGDMTEPLELKCEYSAFPLAVETINPRLSWILVSDRHNQKQSAYRIIVAASKEILDKNIGDLWDSQKVLSDESVHKDGMIDPASTGVYATNGSRKRGGNRSTELLPDGKRHSKIL